MLALYLAGSLVGVALLVLLNLSLFGRAKTDVGTADTVSARLAREIPGFRAGRFARDAQGRAALIENAADRSVFLVEALGDDVVTRKLLPSQPITVDRNGATLELRLADFTFPRAKIRFDDEAAAREWERRLEG